MKFALRALAILLATVGVDVALAEGPAPETGAERTDPPPAQAGTREDRRDPPPRSARPDLPIYVPPDLGTPTRIRGGGTRGAIPRYSIKLLAPDHVGLTTRPQPVLYWHVDERVVVPVEVLVRDERSGRAVFQATLSPPISAGFHKLPLSGARLTAGVDYRWFVSARVDPGNPGRDIVASAWIRLREPSAGLRRKLEAIPRERRVFVYAENGVWYDAIDAIAVLIDARPDDRSLRAQRSALLAQVPGLEDLEVPAQAEASP
ncbi:MAG: DUF928 domain-containing protein [Myxococcota bacterium]|nr:DUF928 domain-containing protein [Myxococcota bacterium]